MATSTLAVRVSAAPQDLTALELGELMQMDVTLVTAQKRTEDSSVVPVSIAVVKAERIAAAGLTSTHDLQTVAPGVTTSGIVGLMLPYIRGIGTDNITSIEPSVTVYVDGAYQAHRSQSVFDLADVEQVEILKGPQGTLYGRNTAAGAIKITTRGPSDHFESSAQITAGNLGLRDGSVFVAGPISERIRASFSAHGRQMDGFYDNILGLPVPKAEDFSTFRGRLQVDLTANLDAELLVRRLRQDNSVNAASELSGHSIPALMGYPVATAPFTSASEVTDAPNRIDSTGTALKLNWRMRGHQLQSISSYDDLNFRKDFDLDATSMPQTTLRIRSPNHAFTQELLLTPLTASARLEWLLGAFYLNGSAGFDPLMVQQRSPSGAPVTQTTYGRTHTESYAVFGDGTLMVTDKLSFSAGLRHSNERKHLTNSAQGVTGRPLMSYPSRDHDWDDLGYRFALKYGDTHSLLYAKTETGSKSGTLNHFSPANPGPTASESIRSYEIGFKRALASMPARLSAAAFYNDYRDVQLQLVDRVANTSLYGAADKAETYGLDADVEIKLGRYWRVDAGLQCLTAHYLDSPIAGVQLASASGGHEPSAAMNLRGQRLSRSPKFSANVGTSFEYPLAGGNVFASGNYYRSSRLYFEPANIYAQDAFGVLNVRAGYRSAAGWYGYAWARNLTDETYLTGIQLTRFSAFAQHAEPRTYGVTFGYSWGE